MNVIFKAFIANYMSIVYFTSILALSAALNEVLMHSKIFILIFI